MMTTCNCLTMTGCGRRDVKLSNYANKGCQTSKEYAAYTYYVNYANKGCRRHQKSMPPILNM